MARIEFKDGRILVTATVCYDLAKDLDFSMYSSIRLPDGFTCEGSLNLSGVPEIILGSNTTVGGTLNLSHSGVMELPEGLTTRGSLDLEGCRHIVELPEGLTVGGSLDLDGTGVRYFPPGLRVGASLYHRNGPLQSIPDGVRFGGSLDVSGCKDLINLPYALKVGHDLNIKGSGVRIIPPGLEVRGAIIN